MKYYKRNLREDMNIERFNIQFYYELSLAIWYPGCDAKLQQKKELEEKGNLRTVQEALSMQIHCTLDMRTTRTSTALVPLTYTYFLVESVYPIYSHVRSEN